MVYSNSRPRGGEEVLQIDFTICDIQTFKKESPQEINLKKIPKFIIEFIPLTFRAGQLERCSNNRDLQFLIFNLQHQQQPLRTQLFWLEFVGSWDEVESCVDVIVSLWLMK